MNHDERLTWAGVVAISFIFLSGIVGFTYWASHVPILNTRPPDPADTITKVQAPKHGHGQVECDCQLLQRGVSWCDCGKHCYLAVPCDGGT